VAGELLEMARILVTGAAGFIGFHLAEQLLRRGEEVIGLDSLNDYYDVRLKEARLARLAIRPGFHFVKADLANQQAVADLFDHHQPERVVNLAAQAGVRYSLTSPHAYVSSNIVGFLNVLEGCRHGAVEHLVFASSSSVYGANTRLPFSVKDNVDHPLSLYAASKKTNELMAHSYAHLFDIPCTGLRFFTVYGPWGRPDMSYFKFTEEILQNRPVDLYNFGRHRRDFTYIDDIIEGIVRVVDRPAQSNPEWRGDAPDPASSMAPYRLYNIGNHQPVELLYLIELLEKALGRKARMNLLPMQPGDVEDTVADVAALEREVCFVPSTPIEVGVARFVAWYRDYHGL
jgi:UDP-glucuronate 4-epimerase